MLQYHACNATAPTPQCNHVAPLYPSPRNITHSPRTCGTPQCRSRPLPFPRRCALHAKLPTPARPRRPFPRALPPQLEWSPPPPTVTLLPAFATALLCRVTGTPSRRSPKDRSSACRRIRASRASGNTCRSTKTTCRPGSGSRRLASFATFAAPPRRSCRHRVPPWTKILRGSTVSSQHFWVPHLGCHAHPCPCRVLPPSQTSFYTTAVSLL